MRVVSARPLPLRFRRLMRPCKFVSRGFSPPRRPVCSTWMYPSRQSFQCVPRIALDVESSGLFAGPFWPTPPSSSIKRNSLLDPIHWLQACSNPLARTLPPGNASTQPDNSSLWLPFSVPNISLGQPPCFHLRSPSRSSLVGSETLFWCHPLFLGRAQSCAPGSSSHPPMEPARFPFAIHLLRPRSQYDIAVTSKKPDPA